MAEHIGADEAHGVVVRLEHRAQQNAIMRSYGIMPSRRPEDDDLDREAARLLRVQGEQLDTLRNEVNRHRTMVEGCELVHPLPTLIEQVNGDLWAAAGGGVPEEGATDGQ